MELHVELLCGGGPSFRAAKALRKQLAERDVSCKIIHIDRKEEEPDPPEPDTFFFPLVFDNLAVQTIRSQLNGDISSASIKRFGRDRVKEVLEAYQPPQAPFDDPVGVQVAFEGVAELVRQQLFQDLKEAFAKGYSVWVSVCVVFEGPTGAGIAWTLQDRLTEWLERFRREEIIAIGAPATFPLPSALLEFVPTSPTMGGSADNLLQGHVAREQASLEEWPRPWFRFDGGKVDLGSNADSDRICATAAALLIVRMGQMVAKEREEALRTGQQRVFDLPEILREVHADLMKPLEVIPKVINLPIREEVCRIAGSTLQALSRRGALDNPPGETVADVRRLGEAWSDEEPGIRRHMADYDASDAELTQLKRDFRLLWGAVGVSVGLLLLRVAVMVVPQIADLLGGWEPRLWAIVAAVIAGLVSVALVLAEWRYRNEHADLRAKMRSALRNACTAAYAALRQELQYGLPGQDRPVYGTWYAKYALNPDEAAFATFVDSAPALYDLVDSDSQDNLPQRLRTHLRDMISAAIAANEFPLQEGSKFVRLVVVGHTDNLQSLNPFRDRASLQAILSSSINADVRVIENPNIRLPLITLILRNPVGPTAIARWERDYKGVIDSASPYQKNRRNPRGVGPEVPQISPRPPRQNQRQPR